MLFLELLPYEQASVWIFIPFLSADVLGQRDLCLVPVESPTLSQPFRSYLAEFVFCVSISHSFPPLLPLDVGSLLPTQESRSRPDLPIKPGVRCLKLPLNHRLCWEQHRESHTELLGHF